MYSAWNTTVKLVWHCPPWTRTFFLQQILSCGHTSAKVDILSRYVKFFHSLRSSASKEVQTQSVTGRNLRLIQIRQALISSETVEIPIVDRWRLPYLSSLLAQRRETRILALENEEKYLNDLIDSLVRN